MKTVCDIFKSILWAAFAALFLQNCAVSSNNNVFTRNYQAFITRFNVHYNGEKHYEETLRQLEEQFEDDYGRSLTVHPAEAGARLKSGQADFKRSIDKASKAIQLHSIKKKPTDGRRRPDSKHWRSRSEYNPFLHNSWMLLGKSLYMQGDFNDAAAVFIYISRHFTWLPSTVTEARLWEARCYCASDKLYEASHVLEQFNEAKLESKEQRLQYFLAVSSLALKEGNHEKAIETLPRCYQLCGRPQRLRLKFIRGKELKDLQRNEEAYNEFMQVANDATIKQRQKLYALVEASQVVPQGWRRDLLKMIFRLTGKKGDDGSAELLYHAMGNLFLQENDTLKALDCFLKSAEDSRAEGYCKSLSLIAAGDIYYKKANYVNAHDCYVEALSLLSTDDHQFKVLRQKALAFEKLAEYRHTANDADTVFPTDESEARYQEAIFNMGVVLKNELEDYEASKEIFIRFLKEYPDCKYRFQAFQHLYFISELTHNRDEADVYRGLIAREFPSTTLGKAMAYNDYYERLKKQHSEAEALYREVFQRFRSGETARVHHLVDSVLTEYPVSDLSANFIFIDAMSFAVEANEDGYKKRLIEIISQYPQSDVNRYASRMVERINEGKHLIGWNPDLSNLNVATNERNLEGSESTEFVEKDYIFVADDNSKFNVLLIYDMEKISGNQLLYDVAKFNFTTFIARDFELMNFGEEAGNGVFLVKGFDNKGEAEYYRSKLSLVLGSEIMILPIEEENRLLISSKKHSIGDYLHFKEGKLFEEAQTKVLSPVIYEIDEL